MQTRKCAVQNCLSENKFVQFFSFPKDPIVKRKWEDSLVVISEYKNSRICEKHFSKDCFERDLKAELLQINRKKIEDRCNS